MIKYAIAEDYLDKDPFLLFRYKTVKKEVVFLTVEELQRLENHHFEISRINKIKDLFVFCCYTGLAYKEMALLRNDNIIKEFDNNLWLTINRSKTQKTYKVPLLPKALEILNKYNDKNSEYVFNNISNQRFNAYLKEIADLVGITKTLTHHIARKKGTATLIQNALNNPRNKRAMFAIVKMRENEELAILMDETVKYHKQADFRGNKLKERKIKIAIKHILPDGYQVDEIFEIIKNQNEY